MKIVVEGYDNTGKSTLISELALKLKLDVHWAGGPPKNRLIALIDSHNQLMMSNTIHDRITPISRVCYEDPASIPTEVVPLSKILGQFINNDALFIHCVGDGGEHKLSDCDNKDHLKYIQDNEEMIRLRYEMNFQIIPHMRYDFNKHSVSDVEHYIWIQYNAT